MLEFVYDHDEEISQFVAQLAPPSGGGFGRCKTIGVIDERRQADRRAGVLQLRPERRR